MMASKLKYYYDLLSQPSRAMFIILKLSGTPFEAVPVALRKGEHLKDEFEKNVNRFKKVPCIVDNGFKLSESVAILRYLDAQGKISDKLYPKDIKVRACVDEYLEWQHNNTRAFCALYFLHKYLLPIITGKEPTPEKIEKLQNDMDNCLDLIESTWLGNYKFLASDQLSTADIFAACEIMQPTVVGYDPTSNRPKLKNWLSAVREAANPHYDEAHTYVYKLAEKSKAKAKL